MNGLFSMTKFLQLVIPSYTSSSNNRYLQCKIHEVLITWMPYKMKLDMIKQYSLLSSSLQEEGKDYCLQGTQP